MIQQIECSLSSVSYSRKLIKPKLIKPNWNLYEKQGDSLDLQLAFEVGGRDILVGLSLEPLGSDAG